MEATLENLGELEGVANKHKITVKFNNQLAGKDKEYQWNLKFKSRDFAELQGKIWQVSVPKIAPSPDLENYELTLSVPVSFSDPASILPQPLAQSETGGKVNFYFSKDQLLDSGILASFGTNQFFEFNIGYNLTNNGIFPTIEKISLPPDTDYQRVVINSLSPSPENVVSDIDGNYIAYFKLDRYQSLKVNVTGFAKLSIDNLDPGKKLTHEQERLYTSAQKYWEVDNPSFPAKLADILKPVPSSSVLESARAINNFVVNFLNFNNSRVEEKDWQRLGALTSLSSPDRSLSGEFSDLFLTLARAAKIPSRQLIGFAYSSNQLLRPLSYLNHFHTWNEYFNPDLGWVMVDPTWQSSSGGVDYFSKFDLNHLVIGIRGKSSMEPEYPSDISTKFSEDYVQGSPQLSAKIEIPEQIYGGIPSQAKVTIFNRGSVGFPQSRLKVSADRLKLIFPGSLGGNGLVTPIIPPFGHLEYKFDIRSDAILNSLEDTIKIQIAEQDFEKKVSVKPFFNARIFPYLVIGVTIFTVGAYLLSVLLYLKTNRRLVKSVKKKSKFKKSK